MLNMHGAKHAVHAIVCVCDIFIIFCHSLTLHRGTTRGKQPNHWIRHDEPVKMVSWVLQNEQFGPNASPCNGQNGQWYFCFIWLPLLGDEYLLTNGIQWYCHISIPFYSGLVLLNIINGQNGHLLTIESYGFFFPWGWIPFDKRYSVVLSHFYSLLLLSSYAQYHKWT